LYSLYKTVRQKLKGLFYLTIFKTLNVVYINKIEIKFNF